MIILLIISRWFLFIFPSLIFHVLFSFFVHVIASHFILPDLSQHSFFLMLFSFVSHFPSHISSSFVLFLTLQFPRFVHCATLRHFFFFYNSFFIFDYRQHLTSFLIPFMLFSFFQHLSYLLAYSIFLILNFTYTSLSFLKNIPTQFFFRFSFQYSSKFLSDTWLFPMASSTIGRKKLLEI